MECLGTVIREYIEVIFGTGRGVIHSNISGISKLNESVYEFSRPENGISPEVEVVLFHGVYRGDSKNAYLETWISSDGSTSHCWPKTWVAQRFPKARILSVSYDSSLKKGPTQGTMDLYCVAENLIQDLMDMHGNVGMRDACPLILVGHGFGGLVIKAVCLQANVQRMEAFLCNVKGILFYSTPQLGLSNMPAEFDGALAKTLGWGNEGIARLNYEFQKLRKAKNWVAKAILAAHPGKEPRLHAKEASVRFDVDDFYTAQEDIDTICRPREETSITVRLLTGLLMNCIASRSGLGGATKRAVKLNSSLLFESDEYYVPMERSKNEIQNALNSPRVRIVVLHGLPGSGKTSLAKHLALLFADESNMHYQDEGATGTSIDSGQRSPFTDGVVYLTCGKGANVLSKQQELLLHFNVNPLVDNEGRLDGGGLYLKLGEHLKDLKALIIIDDIWEIELLDKLVVPGSVKYLVITQVTTWSGYNIKNVRIQNVCHDAARKILGNYAGFRDGAIPEELMEVVDEIIEATESHPLALATLAMVVNCGPDFTSKKEWQDVKVNFLDCLTSEKRARGFGETYPETVYAAMTSAVKLLDNEARNLLYTIVLFQGPVIPEYIVQLFLQCTQPERSWKMTYSARKRLESLGLVHSIFTLSIDQHPKHTHKAFVIHGLRQQFIQMHDCPDVLIAKVLAKNGSLLHQHGGLQCEGDLATALCSIFGGTIIQEAASRKLDAWFIWLESSLLVPLRALLSWLLSNMVEETQGASNNQLHTAKAAMEVFWKLFNKGELDDDNMTSLLLCEKVTELAITFFALLTYFFDDTPYALQVAAVPCATNRLIDLLACKDKDLQDVATYIIMLLARKEENRLAIVKNYSSCLKRLVTLLAPDVDKATQKVALLALINLACTNDNLALIEIFRTSSLLENVVKLLSKDTEGRCEKAAKLIYNLGRAGLETSIVQFPFCLKRLVALLAPDVDQSAQKEALKTLTGLACTNDNLALMEIFRTPGLLESVVKLLSKDTHGKCEEAPKLIGILAQAGQKARIIHLPLSLERLVALLAPDVNESTQKEALKALTSLACTNDNLALIEIFGTPGLLENVVNLLCKDTEGRCEQATKFICSLSRVGLEASIVRFPFCLKRLAALLESDVNESTQKEGLKALTSLACTNDNLALMEIFGTPGLLENVVKLLSKDMEGRCEQAAKFVCNLGRPGLEVSIVRFPLCLERLVALLAPDVNESTQKVALEALTNLACTNDSQALMEIFRTPGLLENVVKLLSKDTEGRCERAVKLIFMLATAGQEARIVRFPLCLERLVALLAPNVNESTQKAALKALINLACTNDNLALMEIYRTPGLLEKVVNLLSKDTDGRCEQAAKLICCLGRAGLEASIVRFPFCLERLVALLAPNVNEGTQKEALGALSNLAYTTDNLALMEIFTTPGLLENVVKLLSKDTEGRCEQAAKFVCNLGRLGLEVSIVQVPLCLEKLVALLTPDVNESTQKVALEALSNLAYTSDILALMENFRTGLLENVVKLLSKDTEGKCGVAAELIGYLAKTPENRLVIAQFPLCLERLIRLLAPHVDHVISQWAVFALGSIGTHDDNKVDGKMLVTSGLLESPVALADNSQAGAMSASSEYSIRSVIEGLLTEADVTRDECSKLYMWWSKADSQMKDYPRALIYNNKALEVNADNWSLWHERGFLQWLMGDFSGALADLNKALEFNVELCGFMWQERGVLRRLMGDFPGALEDLNRALQLDPDDYEVLKHRGLVKFMMKDEEGARADAERAILVKPSRVDDDSYGQGCLGVLSVDFLEYTLK